MSMNSVSLHFIHGIGKQPPFPERRKCRTRSTMRLIIWRIGLRACNRILTCRMVSDNTRLGKRPAITIHSGQFNIISLKARQRPGVYRTGAPI